MLPFKWFSPQSAEVVCREWVGRWVFWVGGGTEGDWRAGRQTDGGKLPQNDIARGSGSAQRIRMEFSRAGWSEISRLWDTGLVHTTSSGLREVPDFIELMSLARQSLPLRHPWHSPRNFEGGGDPIGKVLKALPRGLFRHKES